MAPVASACTAATPDTSTTLVAGDCLVPEQGASDDDDAPAGPEPSAESPSLVTTRAVVSAHRPQIPRRSNDGEHPVDGLRDIAAGRRGESSGRGREGGCAVQAEPQRDG